MSTTLEIYGGIDPGTVPRYSIAQAARHLHIPPSTVRSWVVGRHYSTHDGPAKFAPVIAIVAGEKPLLSFQNLLEAHVLSSLRNEHRVKLQAIRQTIDFVAEKTRSPHPLIDRVMFAAGGKLFVEHFSELVIPAEHGQLAMKKLLEDYLKRIEYDASGLGIVLFPFISRSRHDDEKSVVINPRVQFGKPYLRASGIPTAAIADRRRGGDSLEYLARDYEVPLKEIEAALRYENADAA
ncbi:MAG: DUF433 domain-containing protein [Planctomycetes bacterium]|nr:DUF433 domain-containing protein [Planctomycetota bacterium]MBI3843899.1 DUF433 domain-containing protein [Planctomycetota bacterium]